MSGGTGRDRLRVERSGGFGGLTLRASVPVHELSPEEDAALAEFFARPTSAPAGPDRFVYRFRLGDREATVQEDRLPPVLLSLLSRLSRSWS